MIFNISYPLWAKSGSVYSSYSVLYTNRVLWIWASGQHRFVTMAQDCMYNLKKKNPKNGQNMGDDEYGGQWQIVVEVAVALLAGFLVLLLI